MRRDSPYYSAGISPDSFASLNEFSQNVGLLEGKPAYEQVVAYQFSPYLGRAAGGFR